MRFTVAIDGPAASGKGTISREVARHFGLAHLDTGLIYRAVGRRVLDGADPLEAAQSLRPEDLARDGLRAPEVARAASEVAAIGAVRQALVDFQRDFARREGGAILDGRDIGTAICPWAEAKLFVVASDAVRADRRFRELRGKGHDVTYDQVLADIRTRDARDAGRADAPMRRAEDAELIDTTDMSIDQAVARAIAFVGGRMTGER